MTVSTITWNLRTTGDGSTTAFTCAFPVMRLVDLKVYVDDVLQTPSRDYSVTGAVENDRNHIDPGFQVVFTEAPASGSNIYIRRQTPRHNSNKLYKGDKFQLPVFENNYDNIVMQAQEIGGLILEGFQGPLPSDDPLLEWNPEVNSGFFAAKIMDITAAPLYKIRAAQALGGGTFTDFLPIIDLEAAEINGRSDFAVGDVVLALPIEDSGGETAWRFVGDADCGGGYVGTYLEIQRCDDERSTPLNLVVYVRSDEFSSGDVFQRNGVCYEVQSSSPSTTPGPESVLRPSDVEDFGSCSLCEDDLDNGPPKIDDLPLPGTSFLRMARCADDVMGDYCIPEEIMGLPVNEDLTKIYEVDDVCYYVTNNREGTPPDPLFPVHRATVYDDCEECQSPCSHCHPSSPGFTTPEDAVVTGLISNLDTDCANANDGFVFNLGSSTSSATRCIWDFDLAEGGNNHNITILYYKVAGGLAGAGTCPTTNLLAGEWVIRVTIETQDAGDTYWQEKTTGFTCSQTTGKLSGTHVFTSQACSKPNYCDNATSFPTVTIAP